jgi:methionyl-tRNA synthetase
MNSLSFSAALQAVWGFLATANRYFNDQAPWRLHKEGRLEEAGAAVYAALEASRVAAVQLWPFMPYVSGEIYRQLGIAEAPNARLWAEAVRWGGLRSGSSTHSGDPIFPRIEGKAARSRLGRRQVGVKGKSNANMVTVSFEEFQKLDLRIARVQVAEPVPGASKLLKLTVDLGSETRTLVAGIAEQYKPEELVGKTVLVVANLAPATIRGVTSEGMVLAAAADDTVVLVTTEKEVPPGTKVR